MRRMTSAAGTTSSRRQPLVVPTSMYSMNRTIRPLARAKRARSTRPWSLTPRLTTALSLTGHNPAFWAAAIPSNTRASGTPRSFIARNTPSSSESRLTVTRDRPASRSARALPASSAPLVVNARSRIPSTAATMATSRSRSRRTSGWSPWSHLGHPKRGRGAHHPRDLLKRQDLRAGQEGVVAAEDLLGHAVRTAEVAPVGDGDPQVTQRAVEAVQQPGGRRLRGRLGPAGLARTGRPDRPRTWHRSTSPGSHDLAPRIVPSPQADQQHGEPPGSHSPLPTGEPWLPRQAAGMRRIDFHRSADTKPWIASGRSWATRTRSSSSTTTTPSVVFGVCGPTRGPVGARLPHRLTALHRLLQHGAGSGGRPAEGAGQLTRGGHQHGGRKRRPTRRRATSSASRPPRSKARATPALRPDRLAQHRRRQRAAGKQHLGDPAGLLPQGAWRKSSRAPTRGYQS